MKRNITTLQIIILSCFLALGCSKNNDEISDTLYVVLVGNVKGSFDQIEINRPMKSDESPKPGGGWDGSKIKEGKIVISVDGKQIFEFVDAGGQVPINDQGAKNLSITSQSDILYVYIAKHTGFDSEGSYRITCLYKKVVSSDSDNASISIDLEDIRNSQ